MFVALVALLVWPASGRACVSNCDRSACLRKCDADCVGNGDARAVAACRSTCRDGQSCRDETICENYLGYRRELNLGAHLNYGVGGSVLPGAVERGFRHHLELVGAIGPGKQHLSLGNSITGSMDNISGPLFGVSGLLGLGASPNYALIEGGYGSGLLVGAGAFLGVGARLSAGRTPVVGLRLNADFIFFNLGLRTLVSFESNPDLLVCFTIGVGRF
jgi:hypothetical protein